MLLAWYFGFLKYWTRLEHRYANRWGMDQRPPEMTVKEPVNPDFHGEKGPSPLNETNQVSLPNKGKQRMGKVISAVVTVLFMLLIVVAVGVIQGQAALMSEGDPKGWGTRLSAVCLSIQIKVWDFIW